MSRISHLLNLVRTLHPTPLRASNSSQLSNALENIVHRAFPGAASASSSKTSSDPTASNTTSAEHRTSTKVTISPQEERALESMIQSVQRIKDGSAANDYTLSDRLLRPSFDPHYYTRIKEGVHRSTKGLGRSWWKSFFQLRGQE